MSSFLTFTMQGKSYCIRKEIIQMIEYDGQTIVTLNLFYGDSNIDYEVVCDSQANAIVLYNNIVTSLGAP